MNSPTRLQSALDTVLTHHLERFYSRDHGTFASKGIASIVAEALRRILHAALGDKYDSRLIAVEGKGAACYIYVPRLCHQWWPDSPHETSVKAEINYVVTELKKDLTE